MAINNYTTRLYCYSQDGEAYGTGFFVSHGENKYCVTAKHVLLDENQYERIKILGIGGSPEADLNYRKVELHHSEAVDLAVFNVKEIFGSDDFIYHSIPFENIATTEKLKAIPDGVSFIMNGFPDNPHIGELLGDSSQTIDLQVGGFYENTEIKAGRRADYIITNFETPNKTEDLQSASGAPVFQKDDESLLVGIFTAHMPFMHTDSDGESRELQMQTSLSANYLLRMIENLERN